MGYGNDPPAAGFVHMVRKSMEDSFINYLLWVDYYYITFIGRSTDTNILEREALCHLSKQGEPVVKFLIIVTSECTYVCAS